ncbi:hypothetical protein LINPERPRIM_LOCUS40380 [Linum perenne]
MGHSRAGKVQGHNQRLLQGCVGSSTCLRRVEGPRRFQHRDHADREQDRFEASERCCYGGCTKLC